MLITTANYLPDIKITKSYSPIVSNLVLGTNFFSDINASFTDVFGGRSGTYEKRLNSLYLEAKNNLIEQCKRLGGNAIIGFTVSYNELSGKDKGMLMISVYGTPILINQNFNEYDDLDSISFEIFDNQIKAYRILNFYKDKELSSISGKDFKFILRSNVKDLEDFVFKLINVERLQLDNDSIMSNTTKEAFLEYYRGFNDEIKANMLYNGLANSFEKKNISSLYYEFIKSEMIIDLDKIIDKIQTENLRNSLWYYELALEPKDSYSKNDITKFEEVKESFLKIKGQFDLEFVTGKGIFGTSLGSSDNWICPNCDSENSIYKSNCSKCDFIIIRFPLKDNFTPDKYISELEIRIEVLKRIFKG